MTGPRSTRLSSTTIACSSIASAVAFSLFVSACAHAGPQARTAANSREAPPPHLRGPADGGSESV